MTDQVDSVEVTQADQKAAVPIAIKVMIGGLTHEDLHHAFARHRTTAEAGKDELADALLAAENWFQDHYLGNADDPDKVFSQIVHALASHRGEGK